MAYVQFVQQQDGLEVEGSYVHVSVKLLPSGSDVVSLRVQIYPDLEMRPAAHQRHNQATLQRKAAEALALDPAKAQPVKEVRKLRFLEGQWRRVQEHYFTEQVFKAIVDEETGESWLEDERIYADGHVKGRGVRFDPSVTGANLETLSLADLTVRNNTGASTFTSETGAFSLAGGSSLTAALKGRWASVMTEQGTHLSLSTPIGANLSLLFNPTGAQEFAAAQVNGYHHTTFIHNWLQARLPSPLGGIDLAIPTTVNINEACNAYYTRTAPSINFFAAGNGCLNTAFDTIIYHEYGHFADDMAGGIINRGLSEGWGDLLAAFATGQPLVGEGWRGPGTFGRTADNTYWYNISDWYEPHKLGQAWAGFAWHFRQRLITRYGQATGIATAEDLILPILLANSPYIAEAANDVLLLDDDNGNLFDGTPHFLEITAAANQHHIPLDAPFAQLLSPAADATLAPNTRIEITGTAAGPGSSSTSCTAV